MFRGFGIKRKFIRLTVRLIKFLDIFSLFHNTPKKVCSFEVARCKELGIKEYQVYKGETHKEKEPLIWNYKITRRFTSLYKRNNPDAFVAQIPMGRVAGDSSNWIIFSDGTLSEELSREFGAYGGINVKKGVLIFEKLRFKKINKIRGNVAVITTCGFNNFHHWHYDCLPRLHLLKQVVSFDKIDYFVIHHNELSFQLQSIKAFGISNEKIIKIKSDECLEADLLWVPSLPSPLGTVSKWVVSFLRRFYLCDENTFVAGKRLFISRKYVSSRQILNNNEFVMTLKKYNFREIFPEDYEVTTFASMIASSDFIISVHGSGLANLCFISEGTKVVDILAPYHQDGYYWQITNICKGKYIGFFAEGEHPDDDLDLVRTSIDNNLIINIKSFDELLQNEIIS